MIDVIRKIKKNLLCIAFIVHLVSNFGVWNFIESSEWFISHEIERNIDIILDFQF
jgi:hypothetical protein